MKKGGWKPKKKSGTVGKPAAASWKTALQLGSAQ